MEIITKPRLHESGITDEWLAATNLPVRDSYEEPEAIHLVCCYVVFLKVKRYAITHKMGDIDPSKFKAERIMNFYYFDFKKIFGSVPFVFILYHRNCPEIGIWIGDVLWMNENALDLLGRYKDTEVACNTKMSAWSWKTYIMVDGTGLSKIGRTKDPKRREADLKVGNSKINLLAYVDDNIESELHRRFSSKRQGGEWFLLSTDDINGIISEFGFKKVNNVRY